VTAGAGVQARLAASGRLRVGTGLDLSQLPAPIAAAESTEELLAEDRGR